MTLLERTVNGLMIMTQVVENSHLVANEIDDHKTEVSKLVTDVAGFTVPASHKGTVDRFVRDCTTLLSDLNSADSPSAADLCDFVDRKNSLEVQYNNIEEDLKPE
jgi:hypothetical protein